MRSKSIKMYKLGWMNPILVDFFLCEYEEISFHVTSEYPEMMHSQCIDILDSKVHSYSLVLVHSIPSQLVWAEIEFMLHCPNSP